MSAKLPEAPPSRFRFPAEDAGILDGAERASLLRHTEALLSQPTAPYAEDAMVAVVRAFAAERPGLELSEDRYANLILTWPGKAKRRKRRGERVLALSAHLDHPGFLYRGTRGGKRVASFHGGVPERYFRGSDVRFFDPKSFEACATARVARTFRDEEKGLWVELSRFHGKARRGMFGMWDLTPGRLAGKRFHGRVCDDLLGAAAILAVLDLLVGADHPGPFIGIFTRAEETGFIGCQGLLREGVLNRAVDVIGLECSPKRTTAKVGAGPVLRVGDAGSIFEPRITHRLQEVAAALVAEREGFRYQRALMDGGRCESSAYNEWEVPAGGLCLALGNYHNCASTGEIAPEHVDWNDYEGLVAWLLEAARTWSSPPAHSKMRAGLDRIWERELPRLERSSERLRDRARNA